MEKKKQRRQSPSSCTTYLRCPREYYWTYKMRLPTITTAPLVKGNIVHKTMEWFFGKHYHANMEEYMLELLDKAWLEHSESLETLKLTPEELMEHKQDCINMVSIYLAIFKLKIKGLIDAKKAKGDRHAYYLLRPKIKELWLEDKDLNLCGYVDRIHTDYDGKITIGDYKSSARFGIGLKHDYEIQLGIYALLYFRQMGVWADEVAIIFLRYGEEVVTRVTPYLMKHSLEVVEMVKEKTISDDIEDYPQRESNFCKHCSWNNKCSGQEEIDGEIRRKKVLEEMGKNTTTPVRAEKPSVVEKIVE